MPQEEVPLPQADSFSKVIATLDLIDSGCKTANDIANELEFDARQGKYYIDALRYIDLVNKSDKYGEYNLSPIGFMLESKDIKSRNTEIIKLILKHQPFYDVYKYYIENNNLPSRDYIKDIIRKYISNMSEETINRRSSTIRGWIEWIIGCQI